MNEGMIVVHRGGGNSDPNLGCYSTNGDFGYVDSTGCEVIAPRYDYATVFQGGYAIVGKGEGRNRKFGIIDRTGREITPCEWDDTGYVYDGIFFVMRYQNGIRKYGFADTLGRLIVPLKYDFVRDFSNGAAVVGIGRWEDIPVVPGMNYIPDPAQEFFGKYGYVDSSGREFLPVAYTDAESFSEGRASVGHSSEYGVKWGYIDLQGRIVVSFEYYSADPFSGGMAVVSRIIDGSPKYGYIDKSGKEIIPCRYDSATEYSFGRMWVGQGIYPDCAYTLLDGNGHPLLDYKVYELNDSGSMGQASCAVPDANGTLRYGVVDARGRIVIPFEWDLITMYSEWNNAAQSYEERGLAERGGRKYPFKLGKTKR